MLQYDGTRWASRPFLHVHNLVDALMVLADREFVRPRVHVGSYRMHSVRDVVNVLAAALDLEPQIEAIPAGDRPGHELDVRPIGCDLAGWQPPYPTVQALRDVAHWYQACATSC